MSESNARNRYFAIPTVQATCAGTPIHTYGYTYIYSASPDLLDDEPLQIGNTHPKTKPALKKSAEIARNYLGATSPRMPRTEENDYLPLEAIHLIDGDPTTCWCSQTQSQAEVEPVWIRLDLPLERDIRRVVLRKRPPGTERNQPGSQPMDPGAVEVGMAIPAELTVQLSRDGAHWQTVFSGASGDTPAATEFSCDFPPCTTKQIRIIGNHLRRVENWLFSFSIAGVEVYDTEDHNVALVSRGTGVQVSSTQHSNGQTLDEHRWLWPIHTDLGLKWVRIGYHDDPINWHWVEKSPGVLAVDPVADASIDYLLERGVNIVMVLAFGNRHYTQSDPARKLPQLWEWYYENPAPPTTPAALSAWARYVRFMAETYRDRIQYFEVWNEWNLDIYWGASPDPDDYLRLARVTIPILREVCPRAKIALGSITGFLHGFDDWTPEELARQEQEHPWLRVFRELAHEVDVVAWHPNYQTDPDLPQFRSYARDVRAFQAYCASRGFHGEYWASEWTYGANYPPATPPNWWGAYACSEIEKAKMVAQMSVLHTALGVGSFFCETWTNFYPLDLSLLRRGVAANPISPQQPQAAYYVMRNLATALDGLEPGDFPFSIQSGAHEIIAMPLSRAEERVLALWLPGRPHDHCAGVRCELQIEGDAAKVLIYEPMNGVEQPLNGQKENDSIRIADVLVRDVPILIRLTTKIEI